MNQPNIRYLARFPNVTAIYRMTTRVFAVRYVGGRCVVREIRVHSSPPGASYRRQ